MTITEIIERTVKEIYIANVLKKSGKQRTQSIFEPSQPNSRIYMLLYYTDSYFSFQSWVDFMFYFYFIFKIFFCHTPQHVGSSFLTRDSTHIPYIGRQSLNHWTAREVPNFIFLSLVYDWNLINLGLWHMISFLLTTILYGLPFAFIYSSFQHSLLHAYLFCFLPWIFLVELSWQ